MELPQLTTNDISKYNAAASICMNVFKFLQSEILNGTRDIALLSTQGNDRILSELSRIYLKVKDKNIAYPVSISLDNCIGNYIYDDNEKFNTIQDTSVIKIQLGVHISGCISMLCETFTINENKWVGGITKFLAKLQKEITKRIGHEETGDELRMFIESQCTLHGVFPVENCLSYQQEPGFIKTTDGKYMNLNHKSYFDQDDQLITSQNINYEFETNDVYTIDLTVVSSEEEERIKYKTSDESHIYFLNEFEYSLKLKSSRAFYNEIKANHAHSCFMVKNYTSNTQRLGARECLKNNILEKLPIVYVNEGLPVISKKFTIIVGKNKSKLLKYE